MTSLSSSRWFTNGKVASSFPTVPSGPQMLHATVSTSIVPSSSAHPHDIAAYGRICSQNSIGAVSKFAKNCACEQTMSRSTPTESRYVKGALGSVMMFPLPHRLHFGSDVGPCVGNLEVEVGIVVASTGATEGTLVIVRGGAVAGLAVGVTTATGDAVDKGQV